ncbi:MAG: tRNA 2-selenouridine(34) synthase MnmH [Parachlamydiaceae bacterium]|nr:tRNA 2-selenouridine(34) synthase MnmH [Parachlamydiaceae bacterium]
MAEIFSFSEFFNKAGVIFDVRSPAEFSHASIPGAVNLPLFSNQERAIIGTLYKQKGKEPAIQLGLELVGPKIASFVSQAKNLNQLGIAKIHCWRGGMRSEAMTWLLNFAGIKSIQLNGGYKAFRKWTLKQFSQPYKFIVLGGMTGCGKTSILQALKESGAQTIDLEFLAKHRGSTYGHLGFNPQPSNEQFENDLAFQLYQLDVQQPIWIEDESHCIGACHIPNSIFAQIVQAPLILIETSLEERIDRLLNEYGLTNKEDLILASTRISKRLGSQRTRELIEAIQKNHLRDAIALVLQYYDKTYAHAITRRAQSIFTIQNTCLSPTEWSHQLLESINSKEFL